MSYGEITRCPPVHGKPGRTPQIGAACSANNIANIFSGVNIDYLLML